MSIGTLIANFFLASIPEELFLVVFSLILMKKFSVLNFKPENVFKIGFAVLTTAGINVLCRYIGIDYTITTILWLMLSVTMIIKTKDIKQFITCLIAITIPVSMLVSIENSYMPLACAFVGIKTSTLSNSSMLSFLFSIPERIIELILVIGPLKNKFANRQYINRDLIESKLSFLCGLLGVNIFVSVCIFYMIEYYKILDLLPIVGQIMFVALATIFPMMSFYVLDMTNKYVKTHGSMIKSMKIDELDIRYYIKKIA